MKYKIVHGGSWLSAPVNLRARSAIRIRLDSSNRNFNFGFRTLKEVIPTSNQGVPYYENWVANEIC